MLKLGKLTDYAIAVMAQLARHAETVPETALSAATLAAETGVPEPTVAKVLKTLSRGQLLASVRGVSGGYRLSRPAQDITVGHVIEIMDGPIAIVSCVDPQGQDACGVAPKCAVRNKWAPVNDAIRTALHAVSLAEMAKPAACGGATGSAAPRLVTLTPFKPAGDTHVSHD
jgi:FeS assembly SUF system regulator